MAHTISQSYINAILAEVDKKTSAFEKGSTAYADAYLELKTRLDDMQYLPEYADPIIKEDGSELPNPDGRKAYTDWVMLINAIYLENGTPFIDSKKKAFNPAGNPKITTLLQLSQFKGVLLPFLIKHPLIGSQTKKLDDNAESRYNYTSKQVESNDVLQKDFDKLYSLAKLALESKYKKTKISESTLSKLTLESFKKTVTTSQFKIALANVEVPVTYSAFKPEFLAAYFEENAEASSASFSGLLTPSSTVLAQITGGPVSNPLSPAKIVSAQAGIAGPITSQIQTALGNNPDLTALTQAGNTGTPTSTAANASIAPNQVTNSPAQSTEKEEPTSLEDLLEKEPNILDLSKLNLTQPSANVTPIQSVPTITEQLVGGSTVNNVNTKNVDQVSIVKNSISNAISNMNSLINKQLESSANSVLNNANSIVSTANSLVNSSPGALISEINRQIETKVNSGVSSINAILSAGQPDKASSTSLSSASSTSFQNTTNPTQSTSTVGGSSSINSQNIDNTVLANDLSTTNKTMLNKGAASQIINTNPVASSINNLGKNITENTSALNSIKTIYQSPSQAITNSSVSNMNTVDNSVTTNPLEPIAANSPAPQKKGEAEKPEEGVDMSQIYLHGIYEILSHGIKIRHS